jgi:[ribosomal protein S5]-alanine N-acetyltransferase
VQSAPDYFLKTARLGFRLWSMEDLPLACALWRDFQVTRFIGGPFSEDQIQQRLEHEISSMNANRVQYWPVFSLADGEFVGCCGLRPYQPEKRIYELGFHLRRMHWGKGFARESARAVISHAYDSLGASALFAAHHPKNLASQKVIEKLGFRFAREEFYPPTGEMHRGYLLQSQT